MVIYMGGRTHRRKEQDRIQIKMKAHQGANKNYLEDGVRILELANKAYSQYVRQNTHEKARLLKILLSNCLLKDGSPCPTYRKPFDLIAETVKTKDWLGDEDSNLGKQSQSLLSCH